MIHDSTASYGRCLSESLFKRNSPFLVRVVGACCGLPSERFLVVIRCTVEMFAMLTDFIGNDLFIVFSSSPTSGGPASRTVGPYHSVRFAAKGIWVWRNDGSQPMRVVTQARDSLCWELDGFDADPSWGEVAVIAPARPTTAREIDAGTDWIKPRE
jgi:hypothetical protein